MRSKAPERVVKAAAKFVAAKSSRLSAADVEALGEVLDPLTRDGEGDVARRLVERSRPTRSPTHHLFEWDIKKAAEAHWLDRARELIASVEVVFEDDDGNEQSRTRAFPSIRIGGGDRNYVPIARVLTDRDLTRQLLEEAKADAAAFARRYESLRQLVEMRPVFETIDSFVGSKRKG
jgi:hypothetical protein